MGHEIGHHACGHTIGASAAGAWQRELEADRYAGAAARRMLEWKSYLGPFDEMVAAAVRNLSPDGSATHPPARMRVEAMWDGYRNGSPCDKQ
jgi:hypothetical protein